MNDLEIRGGEELARALKSLPAKLEANVLRGALRAGARVIQEEAKAQVPVDDGRLRDSIRISGGLKRGRASAQVIAGGNKKGQPWYAHLVEYGTKPHDIRPAKGKSLFFAGLLRRLIRHPGARAKPFMRPAFDQKRDEAVSRIGQYVRDRLAKIRPGGGGL